MNNLLSIRILIVLCLVLVSCRNEESQKTVISLFDQSDSTNKDTIKKNYLNGFKAILSKVNSGDVVVVGSILESSFSTPGLPVNELIPPFIPSSDNPFFLKREKNEADEALTKTKEKIYITAEKLLLRQDLKRKVLKTGILSSLHVADKIFKTYKNSEGVLVIFSDMIEDSDEYNFEKEILSTRRIEEIISKEKSAKRIPELTGVKVYIAGATASKREQFFARQNFWLMYFKECGATLLSENYGPTLIKF